jgi:hypothetical protein
LRADVLVIDATHREQRGRLRNPMCRSSSQDLRYLEQEAHWQSTQQTPPPVLFAGTQEADLLQSGHRLRACAKTLTHTLVRSCRAIFQLPVRRRLSRLKRHKQFLRQRTRSHMAVATDMPVASYFTT